MVHSALASTPLPLFLWKVRGREGEKGQRSTTKTIFIVQRSSIQGKEETQEPLEGHEVLCAWGSSRQASKLAAQRWASASHRVPGLSVREVELSVGLLLFSLCTGTSHLTLWSLSTGLGELWQDVQKCKFNMYQLP